MRNIKTPRLTPHIVRTLAQLVTEQHYLKRTSKPRQVLPRAITSARGTVIAAEVAVKNMYHEEPELLPAASGTNTEKGAPPTVGGDEEPVWPWEQPVWPAEVAAAAHLAMGGAISADSGDQTGQDSNISLLWITEIHL